MIDLHLHLDGSLTPEDVLFLAKEQEIPLPEASPETLRARMTVPADCQSLNDYLNSFDLPLSVLQSPRAVEYAVSSLLTRLARQNIRYAEIRFAPQLHTQNGASQHEIVSAAVSGLRRGLHEQAIQAQLILCCMRQSENLPANLETAELAGEFLNHGVCALDLAGAEALYPTAQFAAVFQRAERLGIPYTIHAGEADGPESIWAALELGAARIGHGVRSIEDPRLMEVLAERKIPLELCYTSNLQTKAVAAPDAFPLPAFLRHGICATVNTDNMTVSDTTLAQEFDRLRKQFQLSSQQEHTLLCNAARAAFLPEDQKQALLDSLP